MTTSELLYVNRLQCENHDLKQEVKAFRNGDKIRKLRNDYEMVIRGKDRRIREFEMALAEADLHHKSQREQWFRDNERWLDEYNRKTDKYLAEVERLKDLRIKDSIEWNTMVLEMNEQYTNDIRERDRMIHELEVELAHEKALRDHDGNNTGIPTSQTPIDKKKRIPNTRIKSGKKNGGQIGHEKHVLEIPSEEELTDTIEHKLEEDDVCPGCECRSYIYTGKTMKINMRSVIKL